MNEQNLRYDLKKRQLAKAKRLVKYFDAPPSIRKRMLHKDEMYMDIKQIEAYIDRTLGIDTEDIKERSIAVGPALKLEELKHRIALDEKSTADVDQTVELIKKIIA